MMTSTAASMMMPGLDKARETMAQARLDAAAPREFGRDGAKVRDDAKIRESAEDFESFFLSQMFNHMFASVKTDEMFGGGAGEDAWKSMLVDEYAKATVRAGGIGLADHVMQSMLQAQEASR